jgi:hypothetical protein
MAQCVHGGRARALGRAVFSVRLLLALALLPMRPRGHEPRGAWADGTRTRAKSKEGHLRPGAEATAQKA